MRNDFFWIALLLVITSKSNAAIPPVTSLLELRQRNMVVQQWDLSCGAAALATILRYQHGIDITEKEIATTMIGRKEYVENPDLLILKQGFSLLDLQRYVVKLGLSGDGYGKMDLDDLIELGISIVPIGLDGYNHFVVFRGIVGNRVLVADPAWGNRIIPLDKFLDSWIEFGEFGRVAFSVTQHGANLSKNHLLPTELDFVMLR